ncbi:MAG: response regulator [Lentisphaeraceae bacterium]|nr:response regulator [Lentisphaeraceae bacterium]
MVLFVDDDICYLRVISHMLKMHNLELTTQKHIADAEAWLESSDDCQVALINLHMRGGTGHDLLQWIEQHKPDLPVIILSNPHRDNFSEFTFDHDYPILEIPFNGEDLLTILKENIQ